MSSTQEISEMMQSYAEQAVQIARKKKLVLDYSENSLQQVEALLDSLRGETGSAPASAAAPANSWDLDESARIWGGYFGEVVRRRFGGEWSIEKYPAGEFLIVTLNVCGAKIFPAMKVHRRLTQGGEENLWEFYQNVRAKLLQQPGKRVQ